MSRIQLGQLFIYTEVVYSARSRAHDSSVLRKMLQNANALRSRTARAPGAYKLAKSRLGVAPHAYITTANHFMDTRLLPGGARAWPWGMRRSAAKCCAN